MVAYTYVTREEPGIAIYIIYENRSIAKLI